MPEFESASSFQGRRPGAVFKLGEAGLGYYRDGAQPEPEPEPLPPDWTQGTTPEGYTYYWHTPTSTSTWERPTAATQLVQVVPLSAEAVAALRGAGPSALAKLQQASGAHIALKAGQAAVSGTAGQTLLLGAARVVAPPVTLAQCAGLHVAAVATVHCDRDDGVHFP